MGAHNSKRRDGEIGIIAADLKAMNERNIALENDVKKAAAKVDKVQRENEDRGRKLEEDVKIARAKATIAEEESKIRSKQLTEEVQGIKTANETMRQELERKEIEHKRWMKVHQHIHKKYTEAEKQVQELKKRNEYLQKQLQETQSLSLLDRVKLAVDADPMFEGEIRSLIDPKMEKDFERHVLGYEPGEHYGDTGSSGIESDGCGQVESDSAGRIESDGFYDSDDDVDSACYDSADQIDHDDLEASVAIAYVLSKMHYERQ